GGAGEDVFVADNVVNQFTIAAANGGTVTGVDSGFSNIENLTGNDQADTFTFTDPGALSGTIDAGLGNDLLGGSNTSMTFTLTGQNSGSISDRLGAFVGIENLTAGDSDDSFTLNQGVLLAGNLFTGDGADSVNLGLNVTIGGNVSGTSGITFRGSDLNLLNLGTIDTPGSLVLQADGTLTTGDIRSGGSLQLSAVGDLKTGNLTAPGQLISLLSTQGEIITGNLNTSAATGGEIILNALIAITTGTITSRGTIGNGGNVTLDPINDVQVAFIDAQGGASGVGGTVDITAGRFFRATSSFINRNGINASISTTGDLGGGAITINHGGGTLNVPFRIGDATTNGILGLLTDGISGFPSGATIIGPDQIRGIALVTGYTAAPVNPFINDSLAPLDLLESYWQEYDGNAILDLSAYEDALQSSDDEASGVPGDEASNDRSSGESGVAGTAALEDSLQTSDDEVNGLPGDDSTTTGTASTTTGTTGTTAGTAGTTTGTTGATAGTAGTTTGTAGTTTGTAGATTG
ncbi:MAG: hypothetical protein ACO3NK_14855, partial [Prochlorotrichaceae cyanobacterium]